MADAMADELKTEILSLNLMNKGRMKRVKHAIWLSSARQRA